MTDPTRFSQDQERFVERFLEADAPRHQVLAAPPGSGKSFLARKVVQAMLGQGEAKRILLIVPRALLRQQYRERLGASLPKVPILTVDRPAYRELEARVRPEENPWPEQVIAIASTDLFRREEVQRSFAEVAWGLVLWDELANPLPEEHRDLLRSLAGSPNVRRLLGLSPIPVDPGLRALVPGVQVTTWGGEVSLPAMQWQTVEYCRSVRETAFLKELCDFVARFAPQEPGMESDSEVLLGRASSSLFALEHALRRLQAALAHDPILSSYLDTRRPTDSGEGWPTQRRPTAIAATALPALEQLLDHLEQVSEDAKLQALITHLTSRRQAGQGRPVRCCVFLSYKDTVPYLQTSLREAGFDAEGLTSSADNPMQVVERFNRGEEGVLVASPWLLLGLQLDGPMDILHYDLPKSRQELYVRCTRFPSRAQRPLVMWAFRDVSQAIPEEDEIFDRIARP
jgi:hypothetical protein